MKKIIFSISFFLFLTCSSNLFSQSGWLLLRPYPNNGESIGSFIFADKNTGYISTQYCDYNCYCSMYKTTNAGLNWNRILLSTTSVLGLSYFINNNTGFSSMNGGIFKTTNGGLNWIGKSSYPTQGITFIGNLIGYSVCGSENGPKVQKTTNSGESWQYINPGIEGWYRWMYDIKFFNENTGLFCGEMDYLLRTSNGGFNWNFVYSTNYGIFTSISIINDSTAFVSGGGNRNIKSTNYGLNWVEIPNSYSVFAKVEFLDENTGYSGIEYFNNIYGIFLKTTNGGSFWNIKYISNEFTSNYMFHFFNKNDGYIYKAFGDLMKTTTGGNNWYTETPRDNFKSIYMVDENTGYSGGITGNLYKTTNGSSANWMDVNWKIKNNFSGSSINDIYFFNLKKGLVISDSGKIFLTNDSANNWTPVATGVISSLSRVCFTDNNTGIIIGKNGSVLKTTNSGLNWAQININSSLNLNGICKTQTGSIFICGNSSFILKSTNAGVNWNIITIQSTRNFNSVDFKSDNFGLVVGDSGACFKTTNGGLNWQFQSYLKTNEKLNYVTWINDSSACVVGDNRLIRITRDNCLSWGTPIEQYGLPGTAKIDKGHNNYIHFINSNLGFICGNFGLVMRTTDGGGQIVGTKNISTIIPDKFSISQNYPNPFNPVTNIRYQIQNNRFVTLKVYDILGKEIETLVSEKQSAGIYEVMWDGANYPSGVYFYRLQAGDFTETRKMVLIK